MNLSTSIACSPFLQRSGAELVRPRQSSQLNLRYVHPQGTPVEYPTQNVSKTYIRETTPPLQGKTELFPWASEEIERNSGKWGSYVHKLE